MGTCRGPPTEKDTNIKVGSEKVAISNSAAITRLLVLPYTCHVTNSAQHHRLLCQNTKLQSNMAAREDYHLDYAIRLPSNQTKLEVD